MLSFLDIFQAAMGPPQDDERPGQNTWEFSLTPMMVTFLAMGIPMGFIGLLIFFPVVWAISTLALFIMGSGYMTSRFLFSIEDRFRAISFAPLAGSCWCLIFWALFVFVDSIQ
jgi:Fe2+ transport system protein B